MATQFERASSAGRASNTRWKSSAPRPALSRAAIVPPGANMARTASTSSPPPRPICSSLARRKTRFPRRRPGVCWRCPRWRSWRVGSVCPRFPTTSSSTALPSPTPEWPTGTGSSMCAGKMQPARARSRSSAFWPADRGFRRPTSASSPSCRATKCATTRASF